MLSPHGKQDAAKPQPPAGTRQLLQCGKWHLQVGLRGFLHGDWVKPRSALNRTVPQSGESINVKFSSKPDFFLSPAF